MGNIDFVGVAIIGAVLMLIILFMGDPDIHDAIVRKLMK